MASAVGMTPIYFLYTVHLNANNQACALCKGNKKERCYVKRIDWTVCAGLIKKEANSTIVWKRAWLVKADSPSLLALQLQSIKKKEEKKMRTFPIPAGNRRLTKKECHSVLLILRWCCFLLGKNFSCLRLQSCLAACKSVNRPDFIQFVLQWKVYFVWQTIIYLDFKLNYFPFFKIMFCFFLILVSTPSLLGCKFPQHVSFLLSPKCWMHIFSTLLKQVSERKFH